MWDVIRVTICSQDDLFNIRLKEYKRGLIFLKERIREHWNLIHVFPPFKPCEDLILGLPDDLVKKEIWPHLQTWVEDDGTREFLFDISTTKERLKLVDALFETNRKWRHLIRFCKAGCAMRILRRLHQWNGRKLDYSSEFIRITFEQYLKVLPPLDSFSSESNRRIHQWLRFWLDFTIDEKNRALLCLADHEDRQVRIDFWQKHWDTYDT